VPKGAAGDAVVDAIAAMIPQLTIGKWDADPEPFMGPLVTTRAAEHTLQAQADLIAKGAHAIVEAQQLDAGPAFVSPGLIDVDGIETDDEEVFGPLLQVRRAESFEAAWPKPTTPPMASPPGWCRTMKRCGSASGRDRAPAS
jgi:succinylglutamic semialdehyde dehydrogenase